MSATPLRLAIIVGSNREGRFGGTVADWVVSQARQHPDVTIDLIDLAAVDLPMVYPQQPGSAVLDYIERIEQADAFVVVTPEYNHGYPASLKQAIDLPRSQWHRKPVAFVSYGGVGGGLRAVEQLRQVFAELHSVTMRDSVSFHMAWELFDDSGTLRQPDRWNAAATTMLDDLTWWATALRTARTADEARLRADNVIVVGRSPQKMRDATAVLESHGFSATATFSEDEARHAIAGHAELLAVVAGGAIDKAGQDRLRVAAGRQGAVLITASIGHDDPREHFTEHVIPKLIEARVAGRA